MPRFFEKSFHHGSHRPTPSPNSAVKMAQQAEPIGRETSSIKRRKIYTSQRLNGSCRVGNVKTCDRRRPGAAMATEEPMLPFQAIMRS